MRGSEYVHAAELMPSPKSYEKNVEQPNLTHNHGEVTCPICLDLIILGKDANVNPIQ